MVVGAVCGSKYKVGTGFTFVAQNRTVTSSAGLTAYFISGYNAELGAWIGDSWFEWGNGQYPWLHQSVGGTINVTASGSYKYSGATAITEAYFCSLAMQSSGNGSIEDNATKYGEYRKLGDAVTLTMTAASGYKLKKLVVNGSQVTATAGANNTWTYSLGSNGIQQDTSAVAYFVPTAYTVTCNTPSGGMVAFTKNGEAATAPFTAAVDDVIVCTATPNADKMVQNFVIDGTIAAGGSTGAQNFSFTIYEREDDATYNCSVTFSDRTAIVDSVVGKSDGTTDDATVTCDGATVERTSGVFSAFVGNTYLATAHDPTIFRTYNGWKNTNGELVSTEKQYAWTQGNSAVSIVANYTDNALYTENFYVGTSTSDYGTGGTAYVAGCRADISRPTGTTKDDKWLGGTRTVTATATPTNWTFSGVYVSDTSASGGTKFYKANGASSVTFDNACDANIYAIFANGDSTTPADADQGNSSIATGAAAQGLYIWEGGNSAITMKWHSKRFVASMPMTISTARVYAEGYATSGTNDVKLKCLTFQSPDSTDSKVTETVAKSQDAYRMPMRRPEKYIELEIAAPHEVTQIAVATGMEALWQA